MDQASSGKVKIFPHRAKTKINAAIKPQVFYWVIISTIKQVQYETH